MKRIALLTIIALGIFAIAGCSSVDNKAETTTAAKDVVDAAKKTALTNAVTAELACAGCIYKMEGAQGCQPAIKLSGGEPMMLKGIEVDAHGLGLCSAASEATVQGDVKDGVFIASAVKLKGSGE